MKPLSEKTLKNRYELAKINEEESALLHKYLLCFANLYGCVQIRDVWNVFKKYDEKILQEKFYQFVDIAQREENDFYIFNLNEAYTGETSKNTKDKLLVNKNLIGKYDTKFLDLHRLEEYKDTRHGLYIPSKEELFNFDHDTFYESVPGKEMVSFVSNLKSKGYEYNERTQTKYELKDLNGNSIEAKFAKDIICFSRYEKFEIDYAKKEEKKSYLIQKFSVTCAEKILNDIKEKILTNDPSNFNVAIELIFDYTFAHYGIHLSMDESNKFLKIFMDLVNSANRWSMFGWSSLKIINNEPINNGPIQLQIGPNMQKMIDKGELDLKEMEQHIKNNYSNIVISNTKNNEKSYETIMKENDIHLDRFCEFLEKRNYRESVINEHVNRVEYYINDYLMFGIPKCAEDGCSLEVISFIENRVNEKVMPPSVHNIDFFLMSIRLFYEYMLENKYITKECLNEFIEDIKNNKDEMIEDYYDKNPEELELYDVIETIEIAHGYGEGYINIKTSEKEFVPFDEGTYLGDIDVLFDKLDGPNWVKVPEIEEYKIMTDFALQLKNHKKADILYDILHQKKAYSKFKDAIYNMNIEDQYFDFFEAEVIEIAKEWLKDNIPEGEYIY